MCLIIRCLFFFKITRCSRTPHSFPTRRSSDLEGGHLGREEIDTIIPALEQLRGAGFDLVGPLPADTAFVPTLRARFDAYVRSEEHTSELQSLRHLVCRLLLEKKNKKHTANTPI